MVRTIQYGESKLHTCLFCPAKIADGMACSDCWNDEQKLESLDAEMAEASLREMETWGE